MRGHRAGNSFSHWRWNAMMASVTCRSVHATQQTWGVDPPSMCDILFENGESSKPRIIILVTSVREASRPHFLRRFIVPPYKAFVECKFSFMPKTPSCRWCGIPETSDDTPVKASISSVQVFCPGRRVLSKRVLSVLTGISTSGEVNLTKIVGILQA